MSLYYSPEIVRLLMAERLKEAELQGMASKARSTRGRRWDLPMRRFIGFRPAAAPAVQTCSC
jgi:hypothetical protein